MNFVISKILSFKSIKIQKENENTKNCYICKNEDIYLKLSETFEDKYARDKKYF